MKLFTILFGFFLILTSMALLSHSYAESLDFSALVNMNLTNSTIFYRNPIALYKNNLHQTKVYAIIFDAGSTGTRIHVYKFRYSQDEAYPYILVDELFEEVKPGLSSYANYPKNVRPGLLHLLKSAKRKIPASYWNHTWMSLRATAGLRLLLEEQAQQILSEVKDVLTESGFRLMENGVSIMSGLDEGIFGWVTVNFLLHKVRQPSSSYGTLDLGGGSLQITFVPEDKMTKSSAPKEFIHKMKFNFSSEEIYSHSYLGLGLMSARYSLLTNFDSTNQSDEISSRCVPYGYQGHWKFGGVRYTVKSIATATESLFEHCYLQSQILVSHKIPVHSAPELANRQFYVFSYFYDRVKDTGTGADILSLGKVTPAHYFVMAQQACSPSNRNYHRKPFLCLDLTYIYALLKDGFKFNDRTELFLAKSINNIELGWSLGAVFDLLHSSEKV